MQFLSNEIRLIEKIFFIGLACLGTGLFGLDLWTTLLIPMEHPFYGAEPQTHQHILEMMFDIGACLLFGLTLITGLVRTRIYCWGLFGVLILILFYVIPDLSKNF